jgi:hypothetical protein
MDCLEHIDMSPCGRHFAIWRSDDSAAVRLLSAPAATFLGAVLRGESADAALAATLLHAEADDALAAIRNEIFAAPFARIHPTQTENEHDDHGYALPVSQTPSGIGGSRNCAAERHSL